MFYFAIWNRVTSVRRMGGGYWRFNACLAVLLTAILQVSFYFILLQMAKDKDMLVDDANRRK